MEPQRCQEQVRPSRIELCVEPWGILLAVLSIPPLIRVPAPIVLTVLSHLPAQISHFLGKALASILSACQLARDVPRPLVEVLRMLAHPLPVLLRRPQLLLEWLQPFPPLASSSPQGEERLKHPGLDLRVPVPDAASLGVLRLRTLDDIRIPPTLVRSLGSLQRKALSLRCEFQLLHEGILETLHTPLSRFPLSEELVDSSLGPTEVFSCLRPTLIWHLSVTPLIQTRLHARSSSRNAFPVPVCDVEPEGFTKSFSILLTT